jgi:2',3'-cyclic-nucleotide 2'-phosphodiesterase/3'-nucleotidase
VKAHILQGSQKTGQPDRSGRKKGRWMIGLVVGVLFLATALLVSATASQTVTITLMSVADIHGTVLNWNYMGGAEYSGSRFSQARGLARISTLVNLIRTVRGDEATLLFDIGDTLQGTPLMSYYALREPITEPDGAIHPVAAAMNVMEYDVMVVGNHEFNYGLDILAAFEEQLDCPLLAANVFDADTDELYFQPTAMLTVEVEGCDPIKVGVISITPPGSMTWDAQHLTGKVYIENSIETVKKYVPELRAAGADIIVAAVHEHGTDIAEQVPGIDVLFAGHSHAFRPEEFVTNVVTGEQVLIAQPGDRARYLSVVDISLAKESSGQWQVTDRSSYVLAANDAQPDPAVLEAVADHQETVLDYIKTPIGATEVDLSLFESAYKDVPGMDLVNYVQASAVAMGMPGTPYEDLPVLSIGTGIHEDPIILPGAISIATISGMYIFDNTLRAVVLNGAQIKDYLEESATSFDAVTGPGPWTPDDVGGGGYCYDVIYGLTDRITYDIDLSEPEGERIENLSYGGAPIDPEAEFVVAINNYRHDGGCGYPHVSDQPDVYPVPNSEIIELIISFFEASETLTYSPDVFGVDWQLTYDGTPIDVVAPSE